MKTLSTLCLTAILAATIALAQPSSKPSAAEHVQHRVSFLTTLLNLTTAQQQQATTIFTSAASAESTLHGNMQTAHQSLQTAVRANDTAGIEQAAATIGSLTQQAIVSEGKADAAFYLILTPEQQTKFSQIEGEGHFHGGPMHGGYFRGAH